MYIYILYSIYIQSLQQGGYNFWRVFSEMGGFEAGALFTFIKKVVFAFLTCFLALGGSIVGTITGAVKGQTTETGMVRGALVGSVTGAITALRLMELMVNGEPFSKVALLSSLVNGKVFMEWASPAVQKAYQYQISAMETNFEEISDIFEVTTIKGLSQDSINMLSKWKFGSTNTNGTCHEMVTCTICLQDFKNGEIGRMLPICRHSFHLQCIDEWLVLAQCVERML